MSRSERRSLSGKIQHLAELIVQARPDKMSFESEEQFLAMLSLGTLPVRVPVSKTL
jgi:hypothetical protein